jgi:hypothetical protein
MPKAWHAALEQKSATFVDANGGLSVSVAIVRSKYRGFMCDEFLRSGRSALRHHVRVSVSMT